MELLIVVAIIVAVLLGASIVGYLVYLAYRRGLASGVGQEIQRQELAVQSAEAQATQILTEAEAEVRRKQLALKEEEVQIRNELDATRTHQRKDLDRIESRLRNRQEQIDKRVDQIEDRERKLNQRESGLDKRMEALEAAEQQRNEELQRVAQMTQVEAREILLQEAERNSRQELARTIREVEAETQEIAERRAREIITLSVERIASDHVTEYSVSTVNLPSDEMKGRIIGRQGRNIRAIEQATGVDLVVDDTPEAILISSFDPVRREVARISLSKLVSDGRIHPARIEKEVEKAQQEVNQVIQEAGEQALIETNTQGLHREIQRLLGRLKFRTSYGQNQYYHAIETAHLAAVIAEELHADVKTSRLGGLLHDLGKAVSHEIDGPHAIVGGEIAKRYGLNAKIVNCIASHHGEVEPQSIEAIIVAAADAISGARPGARRESLEAYIKRVTALEDIANSFEGVTQTFAIQAGREIRVIVQPDDVDDLQVIELGKNIASKIEDNLEYPGQIRVTVIRETRSIAHAT